MARCLHGEQFVPMQHACLAEVAVPHAGKAFLAAATSLECCTRRACIITERSESAAPAVVTVIHHHKEIQSCDADLTELVCSLTDSLASLGMRKLIMRITRDVTRFQTLEALPWGRRADSGTRAWFRRTGISSQTSRHFHSDQVASMAASTVGSSTSAIKGKRVGQVIKLKPEKYEEYKKLHASVWPDVLKRIHDSNIRDYTIYYSPEVGCLFSHFVYVGEDWDKDMAAIAADEKTREWWAVCDPCQESVAPDAAKGSADSDATGRPWWQGMEELFHSD